MMPVERVAEVLAAHGEDYPRGCDCHGYDSTTADVLLHAERHRAHVAAALAEAGLLDVHGYADTLLRLTSERDAARAEVEALTARLAGQREQIARDIEEGREHFRRITKTDPNDLLCRVYDDAARIARGGTE